jgi:hypothetical protein
MGEMIKMFKKLLESNLADLYKNNIIIVVIDEKKHLYLNLMKEWI